MREALAKLRTLGKWKGDERSEKQFVQLTLTSLAALGLVGRRRFKFAPTCTNVFFYGAIFILVVILILILVLVLLGLVLLVLTLLLILVLCARSACQVAARAVLGVL